MPLFAGASPAFIAVAAATAVMFVVALGFLLAATRLRRRNSRKAETWALLEAQLGDTVGRIAAGEAGVDALHARLRQTEWVVLLDFLYKMALQEDEPKRRELYRALARPYLSVLERRARDGDVWQRARAIRTLTELAGRSAGAIITDALDAAEPHVALTAARAYAQLGLGGVEPLLERIERYQRWDRRMLRAVLVSFGPDAGPALFRLYADRTASAAGRAVCADAMTALNYDGAGAAALAILRAARLAVPSAADLDLVASTLRLLRAPGTPEQREVVRSLCTSTDDVVRSQAIACLARIGEPTDFALIERAAADPSPWVARSAERGLVRRSRSARVVMAGGIDLDNVAEG